MTVTPSQIKAEYLEFDPLSDEQIQIIIDDVSLQATESRWGQMRDRGIRALVAHELAIKYCYQLQLGAVLKSLQKGETIEAKIPATSDYYESTPYGKKYLQLLNELPSVGMTVL